MCVGRFFARPLTALIYFAKAVQMLTIDRHRQGRTAIFAFDPMGREESTIDWGSMDDTLEAEQRLWASKSMAAWQIAQRDTAEMRGQLLSFGRAASVRSVAAVFRCSKPTVRTFIRLGLLQTWRKRRGTPRHTAQLVDVVSAIEFVALSHRVLDRSPREADPFSRVRARVQREGTVGLFSALPTKPSFEDVARFLRCSKSTVLRMIRTRYFRARRRSLHRWDIGKRDLPAWCRENS